MQKKLNANEYADQLGLSQQMGHVISLQGKLYVTCAGLRVLAQREEVAIHTEPVWAWCKPADGEYYVTATATRKDGRVYTEHGCSHSSKVGGRGGKHALLGHATTRATGRVLRNALSIELPLFEESGLEPPEQRQQNRNRTEQAKPTPTSTSKPKDGRTVPENAGIAPNKTYPNSKFDFKLWYRRIDECTSLEALDKVGAEIGLLELTENQRGKLKAAYIEARGILSFDFAAWAKKLDECADMAELTLVGKELKATPMSDEQRSTIKEHYKKVREPLAHKNALAAYFAALNEKGIAKEVSDAAIRSAFGVDSHKKLSTDDLTYMRTQLWVEPPPVSMTPERGAMFACHISWAKNA